MGHLEQTNLPGIGHRAEFMSDEGRRLGVVRHHSGRREVFVGHPDDPDTSEVVVNLSEADAHSLVAALGLETIVDPPGNRSYAVEGLVFDWLEVPTGSSAIGKSIEDLRIRTRTGASVVAVIKTPAAIPAPDPDYVFAPGDTLVVAGTVEGVERARRLLQSAS